MRIYSDRNVGKDIEEKKAKYVARYQKKKDAYDAQVSAYDTAYKEFSKKIEAEVRELLMPEIDYFPNVKIEVPKVYSRHRYYFVLTISCTSSKYKGDDSYRYNSGYYGRGANKGINWKYLFRFYTDGNQVEHIDKDPRINADILEIDDYQYLLNMYSLFNKVNEIDWESLLNKIIAEIPVQNEMITVENPGQLDTSRYDKKLEVAQLNQYVGKDVWVRVKYNKSGREGSWNVDRLYINILSEDGGYYNCRAVGGYADVPLKLHQYQIDRILRKTEKLRKRGIEIMEPVDAFTTDEMFESID